MTLGNTGERGKFTSQGFHRELLGGSKIMGHCTDPDLCFDHNSGGSPERQNRSFGVESDMRKEVEVSLSFGKNKT